METKTIPVKHFFLFFLAILALLMFLREPELLLQPRFWAEEGAVYFKTAYDLPWYKSLFMPQQGYYGLFPNLVAIIANLVPLEFAPGIATFFAFLVQLLPFVIIFWGKSSYWDTIWKKVLISLLVLFTWATNEVWLNTINSQFYLVLTTFLILLTDSAATSKKQNIFYYFMLVLSGLSGVVSTFLTPFFIYRAVKDKNKNAAVQAWIITGCAIIQALVILYLALFQGGMGGRFSGIIMSVIMKKLQFNMFWGVINFMLLALCAAILFIDSKKVSDLKNIILCAIIALSGLIGFLPVFLLPFFIYRAIRNQDKYSLIQAWILTGCMAVHAAFILNQAGQIELKNNRWSCLNWFLQFILVKGVFSNFMPDKPGWALVDNGIPFFMKFITMFIPFAAFCLLVTKPESRSAFLYGCGLIAWTAFSYLFAKSIIFLIVLIIIFITIYMIALIKKLSNSHYYLGGLIITACLAYLFAFDLIIHGIIFAVLALISFLSLRVILKNAPFYIDGLILAASLAFLLARNPAPISTMITTFAVSCIFGLKVKFRGALFMIGGFIVVACLSLMFAIGMAPAPRYFYAPSVFLMILLVQNIDFNFKNLFKNMKALPLRGIASVCAVLLVAVSLFIHITTYRRSFENFYKPNWPKWRDEVKKWRANDKYRPVIWPYWDPKRSWGLELKKKGV
ncbi:MAG: hypothetical protein ACM3WV_06700 [Bacillota bacterium]